MTENKNPCSDPSAEFERQRKRKVLLFAAILGCIFLVVLWFIFRPAPVKPQEGAAGINTSVPDGKAQATVGDKRKAAEQLRSEEQQQRRMMTLGDNSFSLLDDGLKPAEEPAPADNPALRASEANRAMQRQVQGFYAAPQRNAEVEALKEQVAALQSQLDAERQQPDPLELAEEQYKLARKYLGGGVPVDEEAVEQAKQRKDSRLSVMRPVREGEVEASTLDTRADFTVERNLGFLTAAGGVAHADTPTVRACVASTQVIRAGSTVQLRLLEAVRIDGVTIPRNTPLYSLATISGMRLQVVVSSVEYGGRIFAVEAVAYGAQRPELPRADGPQRGAGIRRADCRHERKRHPFGRTADVVRTGARRIAGFVAVCRREAPRGEDNPQSQPSAIIDFKTAVK